MIRSSLLFLLLLQLTVTAQTIQNTPWQQVVPSDGLPEEVRIQKANNNLDLAYYNDRYFLAFRTAPSHFASSKTKLYVISSEDLTTWKFEKEIHLKNDIREPRFIVYNNTLFLYYFEGGRKPWKFEPQHLYMSCKELNGQWSGSHRTALDGYIPWRLREHNGLIYMSAYYGKNAYNKDSVDLRLFTSSNGKEFSPISEAPQMSPLVSKDEIKRRIVENVLSDYKKYGFGRLAVELKGENKFIGFTGLKYLSDMDEVDLGYRFMKEYWGKGIATESARACVKLGFESLGLNKMIAMVLPENKGSIRVLEKLNFQYEKEIIEDNQLAKLYSLNKNTASK